MIAREKIRAITITNPLAPSPPIGMARFGEGPLVGSRFAHEREGIILDGGRGDAGSA